jgi:hypothetical protein
MSNDPPFRCPVCRASQALSETCRRCRADLRLVVRARRRLEYVLRLQAEAVAAGDGEREQLLADELRWLAPGR